MYICYCKQRCYTYDMIFITIFKIEHKLCIASGSTLLNENFWERTCIDNIKFDSLFWNLSEFYWRKLPLSCIPIFQSEGFEFKIRPASKYISD